MSLGQSTLAPFVAPHIRLQYLTPFAPLITNDKNNKKRNGKPSRSKENLAYTSENTAYSRELAAYSKENPAHISENMSYSNEQAAYNKESVAYTSEKLAYIRELPGYSKELVAYNCEKPSYSKEFIISCKENTNNKAELRHCTACLISLH